MRVGLPSDRQSRSLTAARCSVPYRRYEVGWEGSNTVGLREQPIAALGPHPDTCKHTSHSKQHKAAVLARAFLAAVHKAAPFKTFATFKGNGKEFTDKLFGSCQT